MTDGAPVSDWATDFDIFDSDFRRDPYPVYRELRERCPVARTDRRGGAWLPTRYEDLVSITHDTEHFSSVTAAVTGPKPGEGNLLYLPPITFDPPEHAPARRLLLPAFSPKAIAKIAPFTRAAARELLDDILAKGLDRADAACDYAQRLPVRVISLMLGVPPTDEERFTEMVVGVVQTGLVDLDVGRMASHALFDYFRAKVAERRASSEPGDDLIGFLLEARDEHGELLDDRHILGTCFVLLVAGIDTTWSSLGASLWHLATHPDDRERLVNDSSLIPTAVEEFLRAYGPVTMARIVTEETVLSGQTLCPGDRILLPFPAANRDPDVFEQPERVVIDREVNRHAAFGLGIHRCLGSNLARMELTVGIEEWLRAIPSFRLVPGADVDWTGGQVRGPRTIPVMFP